MPTHRKGIKLGERFHLIWVISAIQRSLKLQKYNGCIFKSATLTISEYKPI